MKGCILLQGNYAKIGHSVALKLKEKYGVDEFCAYIISSRAKEFFDKQTDIKYTNYLFDDDLHKTYKDETIDIEYLKQMEKKYGDPNFWPYAYSDRVLMMSLESVDIKTMEINPMYNHEEILKIFQMRLKIYIEFLEKEKPDFILFFSIGLIGQNLFYNIAKKMGIKVFNDDWVRLGNKMAITENYKTITNIKETFTKINNNEYISSCVDEAKNIIKKFKETGSLGLEALQPHVEVKSDSITIKKRLSVYYNIIESYFKDRHLNYVKSSNPIYWLKIKVLYKINKKIGYNKFYSQPKKEEDFIFYPLHFEPELSIATMAPFFMDQITTIKYLALSIPLNFKIYIKEHPSMVNYRERSYYKKLLKIPNVVLIDHKINSFDLIKNAKITAVTTGTAGWEAILLGKPVITFGNVFFNDFPLTKRCHTPENLPYIINELLDDYVKNDKILENFVAATLENSRDIRYFEMEQSEYENIKNSESLNNLTELIAKKLKE